MDNLKFLVLFIGIQLSSGKIQTPENSYESIGCWKDKLPRAIPTLEGNNKVSSIIDGHYKRRSREIEKCYRATLSLGYDTFAVQDGGQCFSSANAGSTFNKYGKSTKCYGGTGGPMANDVYRIHYAIATVASTRMTTFTKTKGNKYDGYSASIGVCHGGNIPEISDGYIRWFMDNPEECRIRCDRNFLCTGYTVPVGDSSIVQCRTHKSVGVVGDGSPSFQCLTKIYECDSNHEFQCVNIQRCIKKSWKCDGIDDCGDNSDEFGCEVIHESEAIALSSEDKGDLIEIDSESRVSYAGQNVIHNLIRTTKPIPQTNWTSFYFEVKVIDGGQNDMVGIGLTEFNPVTRSGYFPGWTPLDQYSNPEEILNTLGIGYHGNDGGIYHGNGIGSRLRIKMETDHAENFTTGDVVGCLIHRAAVENQEAILVQFTKNGKKLNFPRLIKKKILYPTIGMASPGASVDINFGEHPFLYLEKDNYGLIGNGLCRTECPKDNHNLVSLCLVNGYRKKSSSYEECKSTCDKESACTGFSITDSHRSYPYESNLCYVYGNLSNFDNMDYDDYNQLPFDVKRKKNIWVHFPASKKPSFLKYSYFEITMSEHRVKNARCFKKLK